MKGIRLAETTINIIKDTFQKYFLESDHLWLFGSRADLLKRGGDIDLYIETNFQSLEKAIEVKDKFFIDLIMQLGDQKIDIVINNHLSHQLIYDVAKTEGIQLL